MNPENKDIDIKPGDLIELKEKFYRAKLKFCYFTINNRVNTNDPYRLRYCSFNEGKKNIYIYLDKSKWENFNNNLMFDDLSSLYGLMLLTPEGYRIFINGADFLRYFKKVNLTNLDE